MQNPADKMTRCINFGAKNITWKDIRSDPSCGLHEGGLRKRDKVFVYFSAATETTVPGWYSTTVKGIFANRKDCDQAREDLFGKKRISGATGEERPKRLKAIGSPPAKSSSNSDDESTQIIIFSTNEYVRITFIFRFRRSAQQCGKSRSIRRVR